MFANFIYDFYKACGDFDHVMTQASFIYAKALKDTPKIDEDVITDPEYVHKNVFMQLVNYEKIRRCSKMHLMSDFWIWQLFSEFW